MKRKFWKKSEDILLRKNVLNKDKIDWKRISKKLNRTSRQCRDRWNYIVNPNINKKPWTKDENLKLINLQIIYGNKWSFISKFFNNRTDNYIKNKWYSNKVNITTNDWLYILPLTDDSYNNLYF